MIDKEFVIKFANKWIESWNKHDLDQIMEHYSDSIEFVSPLIIQLNENPNGKITNKNDLRKYFARGLEKYPNLHFQLIDIFTSVDSLIIHYKTINDSIAAEFFQFDQNGKVIKVYAHYLNKT